MTEQVMALAVPAGVVNGPEDEVLDWDAVDWRACEDNVRRLRQRIFKATRDGDLKRVRNLQKLMLRSRANTLMSVRQVTQRNAGRKTAGVDGEVVATSRGRAELTERMCRHAPAQVALPVRRVYIPKSNGKKRPLGIPVIADRVQQARVKNALEPEWEARFEPRSYGFRPGRGCHDAVAAIYLTLKGKNPQRQWILDADLAGAFDRIDHDRLLERLGTFPARGAIATWLKAGVMEHGSITPTEEGTPQGGVISPLLLNVALDGMERAVGVRHRYLTSGEIRTAKDAPVLVRYADDLVVMCHSQARAEQAKQALAAWLAPRGLTFNEDKTRIVHVEDGFSFLGFQIRRHVSRQGGKLLITPDPESVKRFRKRLAAEVRSRRGTNAEALIAHLNPIIRGWSAYYRSGVSSRTFNKLDHYLWHLTYRWARHSHPNKPRKWATARYFGRFHPARQDQWVFGDRTSGAYLLRFSWTKIVRHCLVTGRASPDDPTLADYWAQRRRRNQPPQTSRTALTVVITAQQGRCWACGDYLLYADHEPRSPQEWEQWFAAIRRAQSRKAIARRADSPDNGRSPHRLYHAHCLPGPPDQAHPGHQPERRSNRP